MLVYSKKWDEIMSQSSHRHSFLNKKKNDESKSAIKGKETEEKKTKRQFVFGKRTDEPTCQFGASLRCCT